MLYPKIQRKDKPFLLRRCSVCGNDFGPDDYTKTKSLFYPDGYLPMCNDCIAKYLEEEGYNWDVVDKLCQYADIPFVPAKFEEIHSAAGRKTFPLYAQIFFEDEYEGLGWAEYFEAFKRLKAEGTIEEELPELREEKIRKQRERWGESYDEEGLEYLENLYNGLLMTQSINGALQVDQALKICKISYELDTRIREGSDFDKMLGSYDKLVKTAEFTPRNVKNASDFDSVGELFRWLEKRGWKNQYYDGVPQDIVDETIMNIQNYNQRLYTNETGIGDEITRRIEALKTAKSLETTFDLDSKDYDLESFDNEGYESLFKEDDEFVVDLGDNDES